MQGVLYGSKIDYDDDDDDRIYVGDDDADDEDESEDEDDTPPCFLRSARPKTVWVATWYSLLARRFYGLERSGSRLCCGFGLRRRFRIRALSGFRGVGFGSGARSARVCPALRRCHDSIQQGPRATCAQAARSTNGVLLMRSLQQQIYI